MMRPAYLLRALVCGVSALTLAACAVGPDYKRPDAPVSANFKETQGWTPGSPADHIDRGAWWSVFNDPVLDGLEKRVNINNQNIAQQEAAYRLAADQVKEAQTTFFPVLNANLSQSDAKRGVAAETNTYTGNLAASWAPDIWGRVRRTVEASKDNAQVSAATLASARLSFQGQLATNYFSLRIVDETAKLYNDLITQYERSYKLTQNQFSAGIVTRADVATAETQLNNARATANNLGVQRAQFEHAIAILVGVAPADFTLPAGDLSRTVPVPPAGIPSTLLQRRPDIAAAERTVAAANAQIGVQTAAYFPTLTLTGNYGGTAGAIGAIFDAANRTWSFGPALAETLLDFGTRKARVREARDTYDQRVAAYRQTVLAALQNVEDNLAALRVYQTEAQLRADTEENARLAETLTMNRYQSGQVDYSAVVTAQNTAAAAEQNSLNTLRNRLLASVALIQGLGGGWTTADLPS